MNKVFKLLEFNNSAGFNLEVSTSINDTSLEVKFHYPAYQAQWRTLKTFSKNQSYKNWKLWEYDVFEVFLQFRDTELAYIAPYLEMQVSPLEQKLNLLILEPRRVYQTLLNDQFTINVNEQKRELEIYIDLQKLDIDKTELLYGGFFSCLGGAGQRLYFSNLDLGEKLDFHQPKSFVRIN